MSLDQYELCPCGLGKKIKFCCKDIVSELDSISRAIEGQQYEAALDKIESALKQHPKRQSLWSLKCTVLVQTGQLEKAREAVDQFLDIAPDNPIGLAESAILTASSIAELDAPSEDGADTKAIEEQQQNLLRLATLRLHRALANCNEQIPMQVYGAIGLIGEFLVQAGHILAGREHLKFQYALSGDEPPQSLRLLLETGRSRDIPLILKQETTLPQVPDDVPWANQYSEARETAMQGGWTQAADAVEQLVDSNPPHVILVRALGALCCRLPDPKRAARALEEIVDFEGVSLDEGVEAEALAQMLDPPEDLNKTDLIKVAIPVSNADSTLEKLQSDRRAESLGMDFTSMTLGDDQPPPKAGFFILDKELPTTGENLTAGEVPTVLTEALLYGKQTDREARLEFVISRLNFESTLPVIKDIAGELLGDGQQEETIGQVRSAMEELVVRPRFPKDTPQSFREQFLADRQKQLLLDHWTQRENPALDDQSPMAVSSNEEYQRRLLGTILLMELSQTNNAPDFDYDMLRKHLGLPLQEPLKPTPDEAKQLPIVRLGRVDPSELADEDLSILFVRASQNSVGQAVMRLGEELLKRDSMADKVNVPEVYGRMAQHCDDSDRTIDLLKNAQEAAVSKGDSPATWMISELTARLVRGEINDAQRLISRLQTHHLNEPGVPQLLMQTLQQFGIVGPDGRPATRRAPEPAMAAAPTASETGGGLWTPDDPNPPTPAADPTDSTTGKSKLWVPGMD